MQKMYKWMLKAFLAEVVVDTLIEVLTDLSKKSGNKIDDVFVEGIAEHRASIVNALKGL